MTVETTKKDERSYVTLVEGDSPSLDALRKEIEVLGMWRGIFLLVSPQIIVNRRWLHSKEVRNLVAAFEASVKIRKERGNKIPLSNGNLENLLILFPIQGLEATSHASKTPLD